MEPVEPLQISLADIQHAGFPMGGENLAVDLADTIVLVGERTTDLLDSQAALNRFWEAHAPWLPKGWASPSLESIRHLRTAVRSILDDLVRGNEPSAADLHALNQASALASVHHELTWSNGAFVGVDRWHAGDATFLPLAAVASSAIEFLSSSSIEMLRRCASPACSMLFFKGDARRRWCTPNICGNRDRAARHYRRHRST